MSQALSRRALPIDEALDDLVEALKLHQGAALIAPPGSGKTTRVPLALLSRSVVDGAILMLQPRRVAARSTAQWMAKLVGESPGELIGYQVRHERRIGEQTRVQVITEGLLIQRLLDDPELSGVGAVILDEFHERSLNADLSLMMLLEARLLARPDLKLIVMSATMEAERICEVIEAPLIRAEGRAYPVKIEHISRSLNPRSLARDVARETLDYWARGESQDIGHCLVFLPGRREIEDVATHLAQLAPEVTVTPLYGSLSVDAQRRALSPGGSPRVILATNIAETSLTIDGVTHVVDSGLYRQAGVDTLSGLPRLLTAPIALDSAAQRAGRAGRTRQGMCLRLWTLHEEEKRPAETPAELHEVDLTQALLWVASWSGGWRSFTWFEAPSPRALGRAESELVELRALDPESGQITQLGAELSMIPAHPRIGLTLAWSTLLDCLDEVALLCALSESHRDVINRSPGSPRAQDPWLRLEALNDLERGRAWPELNTVVAREALRSAAQLKSRIRKARALRRSLSLEVEQLQEALKRSALTDLPLKSRVALCFARGMSRRLARLRSRSAGESTLTYHLAGGGEASLRRSGLLGEPELIVALGARVDLRGTPQIELALEVEREWLNPREVRQLRFDSERGGVYTTTKTQIGQLTLTERSAPAASDDPDAQALFADYLRGDPWRWISREPAASKWLTRFAWLRARPELCDRLTAQSGSPPPTWDAPIDDEREPLAQLISSLTAGITQVSRISKKPILPLILGLTPPEWTRWLELYVPERFTLPTGQAVEVRYEEGQPPTVTAYLQAFFGSREHPRLGEGAHAIPLRLELLAPNRRIAQITSDLPRFWEHSYSEVRRDLRGRYPKHHWPEDPLSIGPQRGAKRRK